MRVNYEKIRFIFVDGSFFSNRGTVQTDNVAYIYYGTVYQYVHIFDCDEKVLLVM